MSFKQTRLMFLTGNVQKLERALNRGGDIEEKIHVSSTPLHVAADYGKSTFLYKQIVTIELTEFLFKE